MINPRLIFVGTGSFAVPILKMLCDEGFTPSLVITQPPRKAKAVIDEGLSPLGAFAKKYALNLISPIHINDALEEIKNIKPDIMIVADYGQIIPLTVLKTPTNGCLNIHPSLLPQYRGPTPIQTAILNGDKITGVSIIVLDEKMDHGPIIAQESYEIIKDETALELESRLSEKAAALLKHSLLPYLNNELQPREQAHDKATFTKLLKRADGEIKIDDSPETVMYKFRALNPWPGLWINYTIRGKKKIIKFLEIDSASVTTPSGAKGVFSWINDTLYYRLANGAIEIKKLQVEGGNPLTAKEFFIGYKNILI